ncbi:leucine--tRNA ligase [Striga asiatica]|uniref:Leucine--tRNA ligase n=1 Tax=Striga asiatica TaxID=4170 RepID=A0A5A7PK96_STRAF|nr:leucine--tRNA ligase [Striga asiatica]
MGSSTGPVVDLLPLVFGFRQHHENPTEQQHFGGPTFLTRVIRLPCHITTYHILIGFLKRSTSLRSRHKHTIASLPSRFQHRAIHRTPHSSARVTQPNNATFVTRGAVCAGPQD